jgi:prolyl 4-hydroxylase
VGDVSECARGHVAYKPKVGDALMFYDVMPDYVPQDPYSEHQSCPVVDGVKWNAVKWIHGAPFRRECVRACVRAAACRAAS